jgi:uncharacterized protein (DUF433 family)
METTEIIGAFSEEQASKLSGVSLHQLRSWDAEGFFRSAFGVQQKHIPFGRIYSFRDLVSLRVLNVLRNKERISLAHLRQVSEKLGHLGDARWTAATLYVLGKRVVIGEGGCGRREVVSGQGVLNIPLKVVIASTKKAVEELNDRSDQIGTVSRTRFTSHGEPVVGGTRIPVRAVQDFAEAGYSVEKIIREYPSLTKADVEAAIAYTPEAQAA